MHLSKFLFNFCVVFLSFVAVGFSQVPTPQATPSGTDIKITTEEIKLSVAVTNRNGKAVGNLMKDDVVVMENGRLHQATSVRKIPANVLFVLDAGNEISYSKRSKFTATTARNLINALDKDDSIAVFKYADKVELLSDWTKDKTKLNKILGNNKLGFGKRSFFNHAVHSAIDFFDKTPIENRHLVLITDGIDSFDTDAEKRLIAKRLLSSDINVHVISYTRLQQQHIKGIKRVRFGKMKKQEYPPGLGPPQEQQRDPIGVTISINLDREMIRHRKKQLKQIIKSEEFLTNIAKDTNGKMFLPETTEEMTDKMGRIASYIDSQYVVTYTPNSPLNEAPEGEVREIKVTSKRSGVYIQSYRKYVVSKEK